MKRTLLILIAFFMLTATSAIAAPKLVLEEDYPTIGEKIRVTLLEYENPEGVCFVVTYRPNSATSQVAALGQFDAKGNFLWKPEKPGITSLVAWALKTDQLNCQTDFTALTDPKLKKAVEKVASINVAVKFASTPIDGVIVMLFAGFLLFGGTIWSLRRTLGLH